MRHWHVYLAGRQKVAWALDEDLSRVRLALADRCRWTSLPCARIVHAAWPAAVLDVPASAMHGKTVICQADNPPAFYLSADGFDEAARRVDLWIARSSEAEQQFRILGLPVARVPYCVDPGVFRPLSDRAAIRGSLGIAPDAFVIGNFHRDSEGADLTKPKLQKGPDVLFEIASSLHRKIPQTTVLLAGPRRHWLLGALRSAGIPVVFAGEEPGAADDYPRNILPRKRLNELYQALDVCVISSRWEGGPYAVLEALASGCTVISAPVGTSLDVLPDECIFNSVDRAVTLLEEAARSQDLAQACSSAAGRAMRTHSPTAVAHALENVYRSLPTGGPGLNAAVRSVGSVLAGRISRTHHRIQSSQKSSVPHTIEGGESLEFFDSRPCRSRADLLEFAGRICRLRNAKQ